MNDWGDIIDRDWELECYLNLDQKDQVTALNRLWELTGEQEDINELERMYSL